MSFREEISKSNDPMIIKIRNYLFARNDLNHQLDKEDKNIHDCMTFVHHEIYEKIVKGQYKEDGLVPVVGEDEFVFSCIVHYLDEDIDMDKINKEMKGIKFVIPGEQKAAREEKEIEKEISKKYEAKYKKIKNDVAVKYRKELEEQEKAEKEQKRLEKEQKRREKEQKELEKKKLLEGQMNLFEDL